MEHHPQPAGYFDGSGAEKMAVAPGDYQGQNGAMFSPHDQYHQQQQQQQAYHHGAAAASPYGPPGSSPAAPPPKRNGTIMGMARGAFIAILLLMLLFVGLVVGLGAGLGVSQGKLHTAEADLAAAKSGAASPSETVYVTLNGASPTASAAPLSDPYSCLNETANANGTEYSAKTAGGTATLFTVHCGLDYGDDDGATNLKTSKTKTMKACMDDCAGLRDCEGAGWGSLPDDKDGLHNCYMKGNLTKGHSADGGWTFAVLSNLTSSS